MLGWRDLLYPLKRWPTSVGSSEEERAAKRARKLRQKVRRHYKRGHGRQHGL